MTLNQLEYALALKKHGSFKRAAEKLFITQPALSLQIQKLEDEIGIILFNRSANPIKPTNDGVHFLERAEDVVKSSNNLKNFAEELSAGYKGLLKIGIIPTLAPFLVPLFADQLQMDYPDFSLDIHEMITENIVRGVRSGELDAGIISTPINVYGIHSIPILYEKFYLYTSETSFNQKIELDLQDINYDHLWLLDEGNCFRDQINDFCDLSLIRKDKKFIYRSNSIDALIRIVDTKGGMTILPELSTLGISPEQESRIKKISGKQKAREISVVVTPNYDKKRFIQKLIEYIQSNTPAHMHHQDDYYIVDPNITI